MDQKPGRRHVPAMKPIVDLSPGTLPVLESTVRTYIDRILSVGDPVAVVLFGSGARGQAGPDSDIDLLIIDDVPDERRAAIRYAMATRPRPIPADILVMSPKTFLAEIEARNPMTMDILAHGRWVVGSRRLVKAD